MTKTTATYPYMIIHGDRAYYRTGKTGTNIASGKPVVEMEARDRSRIWVDARNNVYPD